jgi:hypothetical protein
MADLEIKDLQDYPDSPDHLVPKEIMVIWALQV